MISAKSNKLTETIKHILYKMDSAFFDKYPFENIELYNEPYIFSFINRLYLLDKNKNTIQSFDNIFFAYSNDWKKKYLRTDKFSNFYVPALGWFKSEHPNEKFEVSYDNGNLNHSKNVTYKKKIFISENDIELYKYPTEELANKFYDEYGNIIEVEIESITNEKTNELESAYAIINGTNPLHYERIKKYSPKACIFKDITSRRNSFADFAAHRIGFYNSYQKEYGRVFFIDDIAHQTGHVIMFIILTRDISEHIKVDKATIIENIKYKGKVVENRNVEVFYHALFTYYLTLDCLDKALDNIKLTELENLEILGRIKFYLIKFYNDLQLIRNMGIKFNEQESNLFTNIGHQFINYYANYWENLRDKYSNRIKDLDLSGQPYNFTNKIFYEKNT